MLSFSWGLVSLLTLSLEERTVPWELQRYSWNRVFQTQDRFQVVVAPRKTETFSLYSIPQPFTFSKKLPLKFGRDLEALGHLHSLSEPSDMSPEEDLCWLLQAAGTSVSPGLSVPTPCLLNLRPLQIAFPVEPSFHKKGHVGENMPKLHVCKMVSSTEVFFKYASRKLTWNFAIKILTIPHNYIM